jgi:hypothetical protein
MAQSPIAEYRKWRKTAKPGADFVYYITGEEHDQALFDAVREDFEAGEIALFQSPYFGPGSPSYPHHRSYAYHARCISPRAWDFINWAGKQSLENLNGTDQAAIPVDRGTELGAAVQRNRLDRKEPRSEPQSIASSLGHATTFVSPSR